MTPVFPGGQMTMIRQDTGTMKNALHVCVSSPVIVHALGYCCYCCMPVAVHCVQFWK